jgi:hypothetical protein
MRFLSLFSLAALLSLPVGLAHAKRDEIPPPPELQRAERFLEDAQKERASERVPVLWLAAVEKLNAAHAAYREQLAEEADDEDDEEYVAAHRLAAEAEVDAELALYSVRALQNEARLASARGGRTQP